MSKASIDLALSNWGRVMRADIEKNQSSRPAQPPMFKEFRAETNAFDESDIEPPPDEAWAEEVEKAVNRLTGTGFDKILRWHYRDLNANGWPKHAREEAKRKLERML